MAEVDNVLFVRNLKDANDSVDSDLTDQSVDNEIIMKTYNKMVKVSHIDIAKKLASSTSGTAANKNTKQDTLNECENSEEDSEGNDSHDFDLVDDVPVWEIGCDCRVNYKEDGLDYEATIIDIYHDYTCLVEFLGYGNQQVEELEKLLPSWGLEAQQKQIEESEIFFGNLEDKKMSKPDLHHENYRKENRPQQNSKSRGNKAGADMFGPGLLPPQPPLPPMLANGGPMDDPEQNDALSAMLMSWYMSGYYTGLYHGQLKVPFIFAILLAVSLVL